ncbi:hypothetical protein Cni_G10617 [Canna indica]|uniref:Uncharacterized protein n=1 Tax=Canna indica TaxID=4628 RepID=A0AAQ3K6Z2_9LILI|nr:hypothetical protein Cni_G10617 [Canna indica]
MRTTSYISCSIDIVRFVSVFLLLFIVLKQVGPLHPSGEGRRRTRCRCCRVVSFADEFSFFSLFASCWYVVNMLHDEVELLGSVDGYLLVGFEVNGATKGHEDDDGESCNPEGQGTQPYGDQELHLSSGFGVREEERAIMKTEIN